MSRYRIEFFDHAGVLKLQKQSQSQEEALTLSRRWVVEQSGWSRVVRETQIHDTRDGWHIFEPNRPIGRYRDGRSYGSPDQTS